MGRRKKDSAFLNSAWKNNIGYMSYYNRIKEMAISSFEWTGLPDTIDARFLELCLFENGMSVFFEDEDLGFLSLETTIGGQLDVYRIPTHRRAYSSNGYQRNLTKHDSVIIFNNLLHTPAQPDVQLFAERLYNIDRTIDVNVNAQKTPVLVLCDENQKLTMLNVYQKYDGNQPVIFGSKNLDISNIKSLTTGAPYVADKLTDLKQNIWNECLTYLGVSNVTVQKKERLLKDEVERNLGGTMALRFPRLFARKQACEAINAMFGLNVDVHFREDVFEREINQIAGDMSGGEGSE